MTGGVLWDLDGTLVGSGDYHWRSWRDTLAAEGVSISFEQFLASFGQRNDRILRGWLGERADVDDIRRIGDAKELEYRRLAEAEGLTALPGAAHWVRHLRGRGWRKAIASSAPRANIDVMLSELNLDRMRFLKWAGVDRITDIPAADFKRVMAKLEEKRKAVK